MSDTPTPGTIPGGPTRDEQIEEVDRERRTNENTKGLTRAEAIDYLIRKYRVSRQRATGFYEREVDIYAFDTKVTREGLDVRARDAGLTDVQEDEEKEEQEAVDEQREELLDTTEATQGGSETANLARILGLRDEGLPAWVTDHGYTVDEHALKRLDKVLEDQYGEEIEGPEDRQRLLQRQTDANAGIIEEVFGSPSDYHFVVSLGPLHDNRRMILPTDRVRRLQETFGASRSQIADVLWAVGATGNDEEIVYGVTALAAARGVFEPLSPEGRAKLAPFPLHPYDRPEDFIEHSIRGKLQKATTDLKRYNEQYGDWTLGFIAASGRRDLADKLYRDPWSLSDPEKDSLGQLLIDWNPAEARANGMFVNSEKFDFILSQAGVGDPGAGAPTIDLPDEAQMEEMITNLVRTVLLRDPSPSEVSNFRAVLEQAAVDTLQGDNARNNPLNPMYRQEDPTVNRSFDPTSQALQRVRGTAEYQQLYAHKRAGESEQDYQARIGGPAARLVGEEQVLPEELRQGLISGESQTTVGSAAFRGLISGDNSTFLGRLADSARSIQDII